MHIIIRLNKSISRKFGVIFLDNKVPFEEVDVDVK